MIACGMCDLSPGLNTPIHAGCFGSRFGLLVTGTADDPISVHSSSTRCRSIRGLPSDYVNSVVELTPKAADECFNQPGVDGVTDHIAASRCTVNDDHPSTSIECVDIITPPTHHEGKHDGGPGVFEYVAIPPSIGKRTPVTSDWFDPSISVAKSGTTPLPCTPAKKPKLGPRMHDEVVNRHRITSEALPNGDRITNAVSTMQHSSNGATSCISEDVSGSNGMISILPRRKTYRHKVLLKLRKKQESNNYDLALFLLMKFGGPDTVAGRSVIKDRSLLECSALGRCFDKSDFEALYLRERAILMDQLSQRVAVHTLSTSQLHRKMAKLLPPNKWFNHVKLHQKVIAQEKWNPFSIFGSALPYVNIKEVFNNVDCGRGAKKSSEQGNSSTAVKKSQITPGHTKDDITPATQLKEQSCRENGTYSVDTTPGINWSGDPLVLDEILWYLEATDKYVDKSKQVCVLQRCFCVTPNPQIAFNWNDTRNPAWKNYRGPRASMGQALSPSMYKESMLDYARLQDELQPGLQDKGVISESWYGKSLSTMEADCYPAITKDGITNVTMFAEYTCSNHPTHLNGDLGARISAGSTLTPKRRHAKMQQLIYYRNYFNANRNAHDAR